MKVEVDFNSEGLSEILNLANRLFYTDKDKFNKIFGLEWDNKLFIAMSKIHKKYSEETDFYYRIANGIPLDAKI